jgi:hypothetical protein
MDPAIIAAEVERPRGDDPAADTISAVERGLAEIDNDGLASLSQRSG